MPDGGAQKCAGIEFQCEVEAEVAVLGWKVEPKRGQQAENRAGLERKPEEVRVPGLALDLALLVVRVIRIPTHDESLERKRRDHRHSLPPLSVAIAAPRRRQPLAGTLQSFCASIAG